MKPSLARAQGAINPPCQFVDDVPFHDITTACIEIVLDAIEPPEAAPALSEIIFSTDRTLYFVRTAAGQVWAMRDEDGDGFMDSPFIVAGDLTFPVSALVVDDSLYVATVEALLRFDDRDENGQWHEPTVLAELPVSETGFWPGSLGLSPDNRLWVSLGADCFACAGPDIQPGTLLSYALDGSDQRVEAGGFRYPADFAWNPHADELWIVDSAPVGDTGAQEGPPDELNRVVPAGNYGFPFCAGNPALTQQTGDLDCADTRTPEISFPHQSTPSGMAFYSGDAFAGWDGDLIVALAGSWGLTEPAGYALVRVKFDDAGSPAGPVVRLAPSSENPLYAHDSLSEFSLKGRGFYPYHPVDVAISQEGWIYIALQEGRILRYRPLPPD